MASTHDVPNGSTPAELSEPGELNVSPSDLRSLVNRKRLRQYPSSKDDSEEPEPSENFSGDPEPPENFSDDVDEPAKKRRNNQRFSSEQSNKIASVTKETLINSGQAEAGDSLNIPFHRKFWSWFIESHGMKDVTSLAAGKKISVFLLMT